MTRKSGLCLGFCRKLIKDLEWNVHFSPPEKDPRRTADLFTVSYTSDILWCLTTWKGSQDNGWPFYGIIYTSDILWCNSIGYDLLRLFLVTMHAHCLRAVTRKSGLCLGFCRKLIKDLEWNVHFSPPEKDPRRTADLFTVSYTSDILWWNLSTSSDRTSGLCLGFCRKLIKDLPPEKFYGGTCLRAVIERHGIIH